jgi:hypothetical protein
MVRRIRFIQWKAVLGLRKSFNILPVSYQMFYKVPEWGQEWDHMSENSVGLRDGGLT